MSTDLLTCGPLAIEVWADEGPAETMKHVELVHALKIARVSVELDGPRAGLAEAHWRAADLARLRRALPPECKCTLMAWLAPSVRHVAELERALPPLLDALETRSVEGDAEPVGEWKPSGLDGYSSLADAGRATVEAVHRAGAEEVEVSTFPSALRYAAGLIIAAGRLALECYPVSVHDGAPVQYDGPFGPARLPHDALTAAHRRFPSVEILAGLPAYHQSWPEHEPVDAMRVAARSAVDAGAKRARYWSLRHIAAHPYAQKAIAGLS